MSLCGMVDPDSPASLSTREMESLARPVAVEWKGHVTDLPGLLRETHVVCLPSYREGLPKALIEGCTAGRPIVTTDVPGCRDVVRDGENGLLVPLRGSRALAEALERLIGDSAERARMGSAGRTRAAAEFGVEGVAKRTLEIYSELLQR